MRFRFFAARKSQRRQISGLRSFIHTSPHQGVKVLHLGDMNLLAGGGLNAVAGQDMLVKGSLMQSGQDLLLAAGRDLSVLPGTEAGKKEGSFAGLALGGDFAVSEQKADYFSGARLEYGNSSSFESIPYAAEFNSGGQLIMNAGRDLGLAGASLEAGREASLEAGRDLSLLAMEAKTRSEREKFSANAGAYAEVSQTLTTTLRSLYNQPENICFCHYLYRDLHDSFLKPLLLRNKRNQACCGKTAFSSAFATHLLRLTPS